MLEVRTSEQGFLASANVKIASRDIPFKSYGIRTFFSSSANVGLEEAWGDSAIE